MSRFGGNYLGSHSADLFTVTLAFYTLILAGEHVGVSDISPKGPRRPIVSPSSAVRNS